MINPYAQAGYDYSEDVEIASELDSSTLVPVLDGESFRPVGA
jgi:phosphosulfolactate phosphohydrolase-like enzyme